MEPDPSLSFETETDLASYLDRDVGSVLQISPAQAASPSLTREARPFAGAPSSAEQSAQPCRRLRGSFPDNPVGKTHDPA